MVSRVLDKRVRLWRDFTQAVFAVGAGLKDTSKMTRAEGRMTDHEEWRKAMEEIPYLETWDFRAGPMEQEWERGGDDSEREAVRHTWELWPEVLNEAPVWRSWCSRASGILALTPSSA